MAQPGTQELHPVNPNADKILILVLLALLCFFLLKSLSKFKKAGLRVSRADGVKSEGEETEPEETEPEDEEDEEEEEEEEEEDEEPKDKKKD